jgi:hypothetical protein
MNACSAWEKQKFARETVISSHQISYQISLTTYLSFLKERELDGLRVVSWGSRLVDRGFNGYILQYIRIEMSISQ